MSPRRFVPPTRIAVLAAAAFSSIAMASCRPDLGPDLPPAPPTVKLLPTEPTTTAPDRSAQSLPVVNGEPTTTLVALDNGPITISGSVTGPDGPAAGATVRLERLVGDRSGSQDVVAGPDGRFVLERTHGGLMRIRAWRAPDLVQITEQSMFVTGRTPIALKLELHSGVHLVTSRAPLQPIIHQQLNIAVLVANDIVTPEGLATTVGIAATAVEMTVTGVLRAIQASPQITDATGRVTYSFVCDDFGASSISFALATGETVTVDPGPCVTEPTTTLAPPPTVVPQPEPVPSTIA